jgi:hypothetical protein
VEVLVGEGKENVQCSISNVQCSNKRRHKVAKAQRHRVKQCSISSVQCSNKNRHKVLNPENPGNPSYPDQELAIVN